MTRSGNPSLAPLRRLGDPEPMEASVPNIESNLAQVRDRIATAARDAGRDPSEVTLIAVSKTKPADLIAEAIQAGQMSDLMRILSEKQGPLSRLSEIADSLRDATQVFERYADERVIRRLYVPPEDLDRARALLD